MFDRRGTVFRASPTSGVNFLTTNMANFTAEIFDPGLLRQSHVRNSSDKGKSMVYRIFHSGNTTPTSEDEDKFSYGKSRRFNSASCSNSDSDLSDTEERKSQVMSLSRGSKKTGIFSIKGESSDYESDEEVKVRKTSVSMLKDFLHFKDSVKKSKEDAPNMRKSESQSSTKSRPPLIAKSESHHSLFQKRDKDIARPAEKSLSRSSSDQSFTEKYGLSQGILGRGAYATVKLCCPQGSTQKFAVKEFRKKRKDEGNKEYIKKLQSEFCIASSMDHLNIVKSVDLIQDAKSNWCVVMEYCQGGDLFTRISNGSLISEAERSCYFVQICKGVQYLHSIGVAHR